MVVFWVLKAFLPFLSSYSSRVTSNPYVALASDQLTPLAKCCQSGGPLYTGCRGSGGLKTVEFLTGPWSLTCSFPLSPPLLTRPARFSGPVRTHRAVSVVLLWWDSVAVESCRSNSDRPGKLGQPRHIPRLLNSRYTLTYTFTCIRQRVGGFGYGIAQHRSSFCGVT